MKYLSDVDDKLAEPGMQTRLLLEPTGDWFAHSLQDQSPKLHERQYHAFELRSGNGFPFSRSVKDFLVSNTRITKIKKIRMFGSLESSK